MCLKKMEELCYCTHMSDLNIILSFFKLCIPATTFSPCIEHEFNFREHLVQDWQLCCSKAIELDHQVLIALSMFWLALKSHASTNEPEILSMRNLTPKKRKEVLIDKVLLLLGHQNFFLKHEDVFFTWHTFLVHGQTTKARIELSIWEHQQRFDKAKLSRTGQSYSPWTPCGHLGHQAQFQV